MTKHQTPPSLAAFVNMYKTAVSILSHIIIGLICMNAIVALIFHIKDSLRGSEQHPIVAKLTIEKLARVYPNYSEPEINALLNETWSRDFRYRPFVLFGEGAATGSYVNVSEAGIRKGHDEIIWPPARDVVNIFVFGGSLVFGYGVSDSETIPTQLQNALEHIDVGAVRVYNFGTGHYYSSQERIQFEQLITSGITPDIALFVDGANEFHYFKDRPRFSTHFEKFMKGHAQRGKPAYTRIALFRMFTSVRRRVAPLQTTAIKDEVPPNAAAIAMAILDRYIANKKLIEAAAQTILAETFFVWQPVSTYNSGPHLFATKGFGRHGASRIGYSIAAKREKRGDFGANFLWLADLQIRETEPLYVDQSHYTAAFSKKIAAEIGAWLASNSKVLKREGPNLAHRSRGYIGSQRQ